MRAVEHGHRNRAESGAGSGRRGGGDGVGQCRAADLRFDHFVQFIRVDQFIKFLRFDQFIQSSNSKVVKRRIILVK